MAGFVFRKMSLLVVASSLKCGYRLIGECGLELSFVCCQGKLQPESMPFTFSSYSRTTQGPV